MMTEQIQTDDQTPVRETEKLSKRCFVFLHVYIFSLHAFLIGVPMIGLTYVNNQMKIDGLSPSGELHVPFLAWIALISIPLIGVAWGHLNYRATRHSLLLGSVAFSGGYCISIIATFVLFGVVFGTVPMHYVPSLGFASLALGVLFYILVPKMFET